MADHAEEQEMEAEALEAIFDSLFCKTSDRVWSVDIYPETGDPSELDELNHVAVRLRIDLPETYPEVLPELSVEIIKGLAEEHQHLLKELAMGSATELLGTPSIFTVAEAIREWLADNNKKGLDDVSMHAQMMRKKEQQEKAQRKAETQFEAQTAVDEMTEAEAIELAVRKRRAEGTPCTEENFEAWQQRFAEEMLQEKENLSELAGGGGNTAAAAAEKKRQEEKAGRLTGREQFQSKASNLEMLEAAAEEAQDDDNNADIDEELFDDDVDLDDLDFDSDDDSSEEDEEVDI